MMKAFLGNVVVCYEGHYYGFPEKDFALFASMEEKVRAERWRALFGEKRLKLQPGKHQMNIGERPAKGTEGFIREYPEVLVRQILKTPDT